jgi:phosphoribosylformylglycinamidine (FGAM) synthase-like enzyme
MKENNQNNLLTGLSEIEKGLFTNHFSQLKRSYTPIEVQIVKQYWSEHSSHKTMKSPIEFSLISIDEKQNVILKESLLIEGIFQTFIKGATAKIIEIEPQKSAMLKSIFWDNAGVISFGSGFPDIAIKVETHNTPSVIEPYMGALTGLLGVQRDILGCGQSFKVIANTDVLGLPFEFDKIVMSDFWKENILTGDDFKIIDELKKNVFTPEQFTEGIFAGIRDAGNKTGTPTLSGSIHFHPSFSLRPLVFCGAIGVTSARKKNHYPTTKMAQVGQLVVVVGNGTGLDGFGGAVESSHGLNTERLQRKSYHKIIQQGDPLRAKRLMDFMEESTKRSLISAVTDNGAGGLSSSCGELVGQSFGVDGKRMGVKIDLAKVPQQNCGDLNKILISEEIILSESQERMTLLIENENFTSLKSLAHKHSLNFSEIGIVTDTGKYEIFNGDHLEGELDFEFLFEKQPFPKLQASFTKKTHPKSNLLLLNLIGEDWIQYKNWKEKHQLSFAFLHSKEYFVRQFDHEVQGATFIRPYGGESGRAPRDGSVISLFPHGGDRWKGIILTHELKFMGQKFNENCQFDFSYPHDPYELGVSAVVGAISKVVALGGDPEKICLVDNFCLPNLKTPHQLGYLVRISQGLHDASVMLRAPFVSGKDSLSNDIGLNFSENRVGIEPTILVTAVGGQDDIRSSLTSELKHAGDLIYWIYPKLSFDVHGSNEKNIEEIFKFLKFFHVHFTGTKMLNSLIKVPSKSVDVKTNLFWALEDSLKGGPFEFSPDSENLKLSGNFSYDHFGFLMSLSADKIEMLNNLQRSPLFQLHYLGKVATVKGDLVI